VEKLKDSPHLLMADVRKGNGYYLLQKNKQKDIDMEAGNNEEKSGRGAGRNNDNSSDDSEFDLDHGDRFDAVFGLTQKMQNRDKRSNNKHRKKKRDIFKLLNTEDYDDNDDDNHNHNNNNRDDNDDDDDDDDDDDERDWALRDDIYLDQPADIIAKASITWYKSNIDQIFEDLCKANLVKAVYNDPVKWWAAAQDIKGLCYARVQAHRTIGVHDTNTPCERTLGSINHIITAEKNRISQQSLTAIININEDIISRRANDSMEGDELKDAKLVGNIIKCHGWNEYQECFDGQYRQSKLVLMAKG